MEREPKEIEAQASLWVVRQDAGLTAQEKCEFNAWIAGDPRHHGAYVRARSAWVDADRLASLASAQVQLGQTRPFLAPRAVRWAAGIAAVAIGAAALLHVRLLNGQQNYASEIGEVRRIELADGSRLTLNTNTRAIVRFEATRREIVLDRGEALFDVARDPLRPFVVHANNISVRAIGTAFSVRVDDARTDVVVTEGTVEVVRDDGSGASIAQRVTANHRVMLASGSSRPDIEPVAADALGRGLAWRNGIVAFAGEPLGLAIAEINRYSRRTIVVDDPELAARPVVGLFHANDAEAFANAAAATFGAEVKHSSGRIHLRVGATRR